MKSTPTSIFISPQKAEDLAAVAQNAALLAAQHAAVAKAEDRMKELPIPAKPPPAGAEGIDDHSKVKQHEGKEENFTYERRLIVAGDGAVGTKYGVEDRYIVWHPFPKKTRKVTIETLSASVKESPKPDHRPQVSCGQAILRIFHTAWWFVEPVFDPDSAVRKRWEQNEATWQDASILIMAAVLTVVFFLAIMVCGRTIGMGVRFMRLLTNF
jgi:hypothetical protein